MTAIVYKENQLPTNSLGCLQKFEFQLFGQIWQVPTNFFALLLLRLLWYIHTSLSNKCIRTALDSLLSKLFETKMFCKRYSTQISHARMRFMITSFVWKVGISARDKKKWPSKEATLQKKVIKQKKIKWYEDNKKKRRTLKRSMYKQNDPEFSEGFL